MCKGKKCVCFPRISSQHPTKQTMVRPHCMSVPNWCGLLLLMDLVV